MHLFTAGCTVHLFIMQFCDLCQPVFNDFVHLLQLYADGLNHYRTWENFGVGKIGE